MDPRAITIIDQLAQFSRSVEFDDLPAAVVEETKRLVLDSLGCGLAGMNNLKGRAGREFVRAFGAACEATVIGFGDKVPVLAASFANGELISALDLDAILPPGHVTPYVLPAALAVAEFRRLPGRDLILAVALAHEISYRIGRSLDSTRDVKDGAVYPPAVFGYSCSIFGATAGIGKLRNFSGDLLGNALGLAGSIAPAHTHWTWVKHAPSTTIKYLHAGWMNLGALSAASMAESGHQGDRRILDDDWGFWRFIGSRRWKPGSITNDLGSKWLFPCVTSYKSYPHCRILASALDCLISIVENNDIEPDEIERIDAWVEAFCMEPVWQNREIRNAIDAQFSVAHGLSVAAHRIPPGPRWQHDDVVFDPSVLGMMDRVKYHPHPEYVKIITASPAARPARVEVRARGRVFSEDRLYPKGSPSPLPETFTTTEELAAKFRTWAAGVLDANRTEEVIATVLRLDELDDVAKLMRLVC